MMSTKFLLIPVLAQVAFALSWSSVQDKKLVLLHDGDIQNVIGKDLKVRWPDDQERMFKSYNDVVTFLQANPKVQFQHRSPSGEVSTANLTYDQRSQKLIGDVNKSAWESLRQTFSNPKLRHGSAEWMGTRITNVWIRKNNDGAVRTELWSVNSEFLTKEELKLLNQDRNMLVPVAIIFTEFLSTFPALRVTECVTYDDSTYELPGGLSMPHYSRALMSMAPLYVSYGWYPYYIKSKDSGKSIDQFMSGWCGVATYSPFKQAVADYTPAMKQQRYHDAHSAYQAISSKMEQWMADKVYPQRKLDDLQYVKNGSGKLRLRYIYNVNVGNRGFYCEKGSAMTKRDARSRRSPPYTSMQRAKR